MLIIIQVAAAGQSLGAAGVGPAVQTYRGEAGSPSNGRARKLLLPADLTIRMLIVRLTTPRQYQ